MWVRIKFDLSTKILKAENYLPFVRKLDAVWRVGFQPSQGLIPKTIILA